MPRRLSPTVPPSAATTSFRLLMSPPTLYSTTPTSPILSTRKASFTPTSNSTPATAAPPTLSSPATAPTRRLSPGTSPPPCLKCPTYPLWLELVARFALIAVRLISYFVINWLITIVNYIWSILYSTHELINVCHIYNNYICDPSVKNHIIYMYY